jgi:hypothetical protein
VQFNGHRPFVIQLPSFGIAMPYQYTLPRTRQNFIIVFIEIRPDAQIHENSIRPTSVVALLFRANG